VLGPLRRAFAGTGAVIADGHHRFAAARANALGQPTLPGADAVLALVTPMGPGGLRVDAIHRVIPHLDLEAAVDAAAVGFRVSEMAGAGEPGLESQIRGWLADGGRGEFLLSDGQRLVRLSEPTAEVVGDVPLEAPPAWRGLDVVLAHHGLIAGLWGRPESDPESVLIAHNAADAVRIARERSGVALLLRAPSPADVAAVARSGARMPRKSTLFVPKPRTGLVLRPLDD
jgi:hypothetical protein